ncbi:unnamed protein product [Symbiodinium natans]|uniref:Uncharacterized protein n=1 Tax=Symbiodinium natans TaxID=878477 RepID=A0A812JDM9_9DINO|nr:unnamed protein product [Symbiodinium natans]
MADIGPSVPCMASRMARVPVMPLVPAMPAVPATPATPSEPSWRRRRCEEAPSALGALALGAFGFGKRQKPLKRQRLRRATASRVAVAGGPGSSESEPESKLELQSEFDAEDPELRVEAANQVGAMNVTSTLWPPKREQADTAELTPVRQETTVGRFTGTAPTFPQWPFYQLTNLEEVRTLQKGDEDLQTYKVVDFVSSNGLTRAFALASRWQKQNLGRSAGFDRLGAGVLSGFKHTTKILLRQLQGLNVLSNWQVEKSDEGVDVSDLSEEQLAGFLEEVDASEFTAAEFRAVAPVGREACVTGLVGTNGSALAIWTLEESLNIQICLGHDCLDQGPLAEERLLRLLAGRARAKAVPLRCRARFTEKGKLLVPCKALSFELVRTRKLLRDATSAPGEKQFKVDTSDEDALSNPDFTKAKIFEDIPEAVPGLRTWLLLLCLEDRLGLVNEWCEEQGAALLEEVIEGRADLADFLAERSDLSPGERQALLERDR